MKKREGVFAGFMFIILCSFFVHASVGVSPGKYAVDFQPSLEQSFTFHFIFDEGVESEIYVDGDFKEYASLSTNKLVGGGPVTVTLRLPAFSEKSGINNLLVGARQKATGGGFAIAGHVIARVEIAVPYQGKYIDTFLDTTNANVGENVTFTVRIDNIGTDAVVVTPSINILDFSNATLETIYLEKKEILSQTSLVYRRDFSTEHYRAGNYRAILFVDIGREGVSVKEKTFRLGGLYVSIINASEHYEKNKINKFTIEVESFWNDPINNLYANVSFINSNVSFITPSLYIPSWEKKILTGFFDSTDFGNTITANITLHYQDISSSSLARLTPIENSHKDIFGIFLGIVIGILLMTVIFLTWRIYGKQNRKKK